MTPLTNPAVSRQTPLRPSAVTAGTPSSLPGIGRPTPSASEPVPMHQPYPSRPTPSISTPSIMPSATPAYRPTPVVTAMPSADFTTEPAPFPEPATATSAYSAAQAARPLVPPPPPSPGQMVSMAVPTPSSATAAVSGAAGDQRRVINPFLRSDPMTRAKRLARALVSDMVAYQPQKRAEGLSNGTLKQLFRDEIRKSYDEYVEQVGREVAESTAFFQDALNEVLAEGKRVF